MLDTETFTFKGWLIVLDRKVWGYYGVALGPANERLTLKMLGAGRREARKHMRDLVREALATS